MNCRSILTLCLFLFVVAPIKAQEIPYPSWFKISFMDLPADLQEAAEAGRHLVLLFHQNGCPYCKALVERNFSQQNIVKAMNESFDAIAINMWGDIEVIAPNGQEMQEKALAEQYQVQFTPTLLFLNHDGTIRLRLNGYVRPQIFLAALNYITEDSPLSFGEYVRDHDVADNIPIIEDPLLLNEPEDLRVLHQDKAYALLFEQVDCIDCRALHEKVLSNEETRTLLTRLPTAQLERFSLKEIIDFDGKTTTPSDLAKQYEVNFTPTWILFSPDGEEILRLESTLYNFHTQAAMEYALDAVYDREPSFQRYINERAERFREQGRDINITQ